LAVFGVPFLLTYDQLRPMMLRCFASLLTVAALASRVSAQARNHATCTTAQWTYNRGGQSPCVVNTYLMAQCYTGGFDLYNPPYHGARRGQSNDCWCSSVAYNTLAACSYCQDVPLINWPTYIQNCSSSNVRSGTWPRTIPAAISVPAWAYLRPEDYNNEWNATAAQALVTQSAFSSPSPSMHTFTHSVATDTTDVLGGSPPTTLFQSTRPTSGPTSSPTSTSKITNTIRIIIGVAAGAAFLLGAILIAYWVRKRRAPVQQPMTTVIYTGATPNVGVKYEPVGMGGPPPSAGGYYDPNYRGYTPSNQSTYAGPEQQQQTGGYPAYNYGAPPVPPNPPVQDYGYPGYPPPVGGPVPPR